MISSRTLATAILVAGGALGSRTAAAATVHPISARNDATIVSLSVVAATGRAELVIKVDGAVTFKHFTMTKPDKIVVDMSGATLGLPAGDAYDGVARGGIKGIRYSQFTKNVVRVVITLDAPHPYDVTQQDGALRVSVEGALTPFDAWRIGNDVRAPAAAAPVAPVAPEKPAPVVPVVPVAPVSTKPQQSQEQRISINWENTPISEVLGMFSAFTHRTILPSKSVVGTVTASVVDLPWDLALKEVMNANGYDVTVNPDGVIVIDTYENISTRRLTQQSTMPLSTRQVRLNYARAVSVQAMVQVRLSRSCPQSVTTTTSVPTSSTPAQPVPGQPTAMPTPQAQQSQSINTVQSLQCPQRGAVVADTLTNSVQITDVASALEELEAYAHSLDIRQPQVNIKAKIILVDRSTLEGLGLRYDIGSQQQFFNDLVPRLDSAGNPLTTAGQILLGGNTISAIANATARVPSAALQLVYSTALGNFDFTTFLEALQTNTLLDVQAEPNTTILNNRTANLTAGTQVPIRVIDAGSAAGNTSNAPRANVTMQQTGVILTVTPQITNNRQVQMKVHVENSDVQFQSNDVGAVFPTQKVDNEMLVADGETMVVGGLTQTTVTVTRSGLPILIDLPIIGRLFGVTNRTESKRDLLILITPHIIDEGSQPDSGRP